MKWVANSLEFQMLSKIIAHDLGIFKDANPLQPIVVETEQHKQSIGKSLYTGKICHLCLIQVTYSPHTSQYNGFGSIHVKHFL